MASNHLRTGQFAWKDLPSAEPEQHGRIRYAALPVSELEEAYISRDEQGRPIFLLRCSEGGGAQGVRLKQMTIAHGVQCVLSLLDERSVAGEFSIINCRAYDEELQQLFVDCVGDLIPQKVAARSGSVLDEMISYLVALFSAATSPSRKSVAGLWGELLALSSAKNVRRAVQAWHCQLDEHFDLCEGNERLEIKTSRSQERRHTFSLEQANPPDGVAGYVLSMVVEPMATGTSVGELRHAVLKTLGADLELRAKVDRQCAECLGGEWAQGVNWAFDEHAARASAQFYNLDSIPKITAPPPAGVTEVRFVACLSLSSPEHRAINATGIVADVWEGIADGG